MGRRNENPIQAWINSDEELAKILFEIEETHKPVAEQAEIGFHRISDFYGLPKFPEDLEEREEFETSVYEQLGYLKFLYQDDDLRGTVLFSIYLVKNNQTVDTDEIYFKKFGSSVPNSVGICLKGEGSQVELAFVEDGKNWFDLGCRVFVKRS